MVQNWATENHLPLNLSKCKIIIFQCVDENFDFSVTVGEFQVEIVTELRVLGVIIDNKLNFVLHVQNIIERIKPRLRAIRCLVGQ